MSVEPDIWKYRVGSGGGGRSSLMTMMMRIVRTPSGRRAVGLIDVFGAVVEVGL